MQNTYNKQTAKFIAMVVQNMPDLTSDLMQGWIQNPMALKKALAVLRPPSSWKNVTIGLYHETPVEFREAIKSAGMYIGDWGNDILNNSINKLCLVEGIELVVVSNADLGFKNGAKLEETYARAHDLGLHPCPNEVGPQVRLQYTDQPRGEFLVIAMKPFYSSDGDCLKLFTVDHHNEGGLYLDGVNGNPDFFWKAYTQFVFRINK